MQETLQDALALVLRLPQVQLQVAGRTDAGVHATGQVAHVDLPAQLWAELGATLVHRLAGVLSPDVRVRAVRAVPAEFDARFGALWRRYEYLITDAPFGAEPLRRRQVLRWPRPLDDSAMRRAAEPLLGLHDFAAFCRRRDGATTIRDLQRLDVERDGDQITATVLADAFCRSMVRSLVGALLAVGDGRAVAEWPASLLSRDRRADEVTVAPAHGLTLLAVGYPPDDELAARAALTATRRTRP